MSTGATSGGETLLGFAVGKLLLASSRESQGCCSKSYYARDSPPDEESSIPKWQQSEAEIP